MNKLLEFQKKVGVIKKGSVNPFYKSKYADINGVLDEIKPILNELGLVLTQPLEVRDGKNILATYLKEDDKTLLESAIVLPENPDPQKIGSAITYYRRYSLQAMLSLEAEDDDAESAKPKVRNFTAEASKLMDLNALTNWYNSLTPDEQKQAKSVAKNRKEEIKELDKTPFGKTG